MRPDPRRDTTPLVIGLGNEHRRDDRAGLDAVRALAPRVGGRAELAEDPGDVARLLDLWEGRENVFVVDAVRSGRPPGTVVRFEVKGPDLPSGVGATSSHGLSLADAVALGRALGRLPSHLTVYGIEAGAMDTGRGLSPPVASGVQEVVARIELELATASPRAGANAPEEPCTKNG